MASGCLTTLSLPLKAPRRTWPGSQEAGAGPHLRSSFQAQGSLQFILPGSLWKPGCAGGTVGHQPGPGGRVGEVPGLDLLGETALAPSSPHPQPSSPPTHRTGSFLYPLPRAEPSTDLGSGIGLWAEQGLNTRSPGGTSGFRRWRGLHREEARRMNLPRLSPRSPKPQRLILVAVMHRGASPGQTWGPLSPGQHLTGSGQVGFPFPQSTRRLLSSKLKLQK